MAEGTRDEGHYYSSKKKEENMSKIVHRMKRTFSSQAQGEVAKRPLVPEKADDGGKPQPETDPELGPHKSKQRKITEF
jgi:ERCC4-related helicase